MLRGQMMDMPLSIPRIIDFAAEVHADREVVSATVEGGRHAYTYADAARRVARAAHALRALGVAEGDRVATLAWNGYRHFELYYAISGIGAVCHTINPRLFDDQIAYIAGHAQDRLIFTDLTFLPKLAELLPRLPDGLRVVALCASGDLPADSGIPGLMCYETLLDGQPDHIDWPELDEWTASGLCYTSGTTGMPKGALYSHRSTLLHAFAEILGVWRSFGPENRILPVVPLFHVNAWGLPYAAPLAGSGLVFPGPRLDGASLWELIDAEAVTAGWGVPTVWQGLLEEMRRRGAAPATLSRLVIGGSAATRPLIAALEGEFGIEVIHAWGMTEMSPVGTANQFARWPEVGSAESLEAKASAGKRFFAVDMRIVGDDGTPQPHDGAARGELQVRGPAVISGYYENPEAGRAALDGGWFRTGDVARIHPSGDLEIVDRTKDLIKSGGEWISSIEIEAIAASHSGVAHAACVAVPHPHWDERPVLVVVPAGEGAPTREDLLAHVARHVAKWQVPDDVVFVEALPLTATGKVSKLEIRALLGDYRLPEN